MGSNQRGVAYDPNDVARTTIKETNIHDTRTGNMGSNQRGVAYDPNDVARTTIKETNIHDTRGASWNKQKGVAYDPNDVARTTIKETNIHDTRTGNMESRQKELLTIPMMSQEQQLKKLTYTIQELLIYKQRLKMQELF